MTTCWLNRRDARHVLIVHPSLLHPGGCRVTWWDEIGPGGHTEHDTVAEALAERVGSEYDQVDVEPPWLGLTVITQGAIDPLGAPYRPRANRPVK